MIEEWLFQALIDYGTLGIMIIYLMYDRQVLLKKLMAKLDDLSGKIDQCGVNRGS